jgi:prepilin-type N-terminal cleavage/methylation domain-containing protein
VNARAGVTLIELIVVLAMLSILAGVVALALRAEPSHDPGAATRALALAARDSSLRSGRAVSFISVVNDVEQAATAYPDGRIVAEASFRIDALSGRAADATR